MTAAESGAYAVWLDDESRVASLHHEEGWREVRFDGRESFIRFISELTALSGGGYRIHRISLSFRLFANARTRMALSGR